MRIDYHSAGHGSSADRDLLRSLDLNEKISLLHQWAPRIEHVGLAAFRTGTEAAHGMAWLGPATVFPQPVGLAASWDEDLLRRIGTAVATEVRSKHAQDPTVSLNVWAPVVNPLRHPRWGRNEEGFSEDPDLTAALAIGYAAGLRGRDEQVWKTVPTIKHVLGYGNETDRAVTSSHLPPQALREYEWPCYAGPLASGVVGAMMPSYNLINGRPAHLAVDLLSELRALAPGDVAVVSDAYAPSNLVTGQYYVHDHVEAHALALRAGVDSFTDNDSDPGPTTARLHAAVRRGLIDEADVDRALRRVLRMRERTGEFTATDPDRLGAEPIESPDHRALARESVARSVVVMANADGALPLAANPGIIAVVGPFADHVTTDWYAGTLPYSVSLAQALRERYPRTQLRIASGADRIALQAGNGRYLSVTNSGVTVRARELSPAPSTHFEVTDWGEDLLTLTSMATGGLLSGANWICAANAERIGGWVVQESFRRAPQPGGTVCLQHIGSGRWLRIQHGSGLLVADGTAENAERFTVQMLTSGSARVTDACTAADVVLAALGNDPHLNGRETEDRPHLDLPAPMQRIWRLATAASDRCILTLISSYPYAIETEAKQASAVVWTSHGGQELGHGLVDVLSGDTEPSARLAQTWWADETHAGDLMEYDVVGAEMTYRYSAAEPLFALGHGLSYTDVEYQDLQISTDRLPAPPPTRRHTPARSSSEIMKGHGDDAGPGCSDVSSCCGPPGEGVASPGGAGRDHLEVRVRVANSGDRPVRELVAIYSQAPDLPVRAPRTRLAGWRHVHLPPGQSRTVTVPVDPKVLAVWDVGAQVEQPDEAGGSPDWTPGAYRVQPGRYRLATGASAAALRIGAALEVTGAAAPPRRVDHLLAHGFHASSGVITSDRTVERGSCIELTSDAEHGWARYDHLDLTGLTGIHVQIADRDLPSGAPSGVALDVARRGGEHRDGGTWQPLHAPHPLWGPRGSDPYAPEASAAPQRAVPDGAFGDRYRWRRLDLTVSPDVTAVLTDCTSLRLRLSGAIRVAGIAFLRAP